MKTRLILVLLWIAGAAWGEQTNLEAVVPAPAQKINTNLNAYAKNKKGYWDSLGIKDELGLFNGLRWRTFDGTLYDLWSVAEIDYDLKAAGRERTRLLAKQSSLRGQKQQIAQQEGLAKAQARIKKSGNKKAMEGPVAKIPVLDPSELADKKDDYAVAVEKTEDDMEKIEIIQEKLKTRQRKADFICLRSKVIQIFDNGIWLEDGFVVNCPKQGCIIPIEGFVGIVKPCGKYQFTTGLGVEKIVPKYDFGILPER